MIKYMFPSLVLGLGGLGIYLYFYLGLSLPVEISVETRAPITLLWQEHRGAYHQIMPVIQKAETWAQANQVPCPKTFGEFLDDPAAVEQDRLRSRAGCVLNTELETVPEGFTLETRAARSYVVGRFAGSPSVGPMTVYPAIKEYIAEKRLKSSAPPLEIYTVNGSSVTTEYLFPLD